ncbi:MAG: hypothetical protein H6739_41480 [Alphaproteobacteria bacterium]|nr:hypothetical protein [Alphaproteobacteria bacterium]
MRRWMPALAALLGAPLLATADSGHAEVLQQAWLAHQPARDVHSKYPIHLRSRDFDVLAKGDIVARIVRSDTGDRVLGAFVSDVSRLRLWLAVQDAPHRVDDPSLVQVFQPGTTLTHQLLYLHIDTPWPVQDRQSMVDIRYNGPLRVQSGDGIWERTWRTGTPDQASAPDPEALWMPVNEGGWQLVEVGGGKTLGVVSLRLDIGGAVPEEVAMRWGLATLDNTLQGIIDAGRTMHTHYVPGHEPIAMPDGAPIPRGPLP